MKIHPISELTCEIVWKMWPSIDSELLTGLGVNIFPNALLREGLVYVVKGLIFFLTRVFSIVVHSINLDSLFQSVIRRVLIYEKGPNRENP